MLNNNPGFEPQPWDSYRRLNKVRNGSQTDLVKIKDDRKANPLQTSNFISAQNYLAIKLHFNHFDPTFTFQDKTSDIFDIIFESIFVCFR